MSGPTTILTPFQTNLSVGATAMMAAIPANPTRKALVIANNAPLTGGPPATGPAINVTFGPNVPTTPTGIPIAAGTAFSFFPYAANDISMGAQINVIAGAAATPVSVLEF